MITKSVLALVAMLLASPAAAEDTKAAPECRSLESVSTMAISRLPAQIQKDISVRVLPVMKVSGFMEAYNQLPPTTDTVADQVVLMSHPKIAGMFVIILNEGCVVDSGAVPTKMIQRIMNYVNKTSI